tara:strand:- start:719 stop:2002 length:1284 start_codon:yes stop_codon:yes gene_type:complete
MILAYRIFSTILYPFLFIFIYCRKILNKEETKRFKEKIFVSHFNVIKKDKFKLIWFHSASIGELKSIIPIINQLNIRYKNLKFLITTTTLSSGNLAKIELQKFNNIEHRYVPFDVNFLISKFIDLWKPNQIFLVDSEIWPNLILKAKKNKIPIALINARLTSRSFNRWMIFPNVAKEIFSIFDLFICSNSETKMYLEKLGLQNIYFKGNIKFIEKVDEKKIKNLNENILVKKNFWFAASTHKGEDVMCLKTHLKLKKKFKDLITVIAPRHIKRTTEIKKLSNKLKLNTQILNNNEKILEDKEIIIINYFGALKSYFKYAKSVFIGKSMFKKFMNNGGQNPIEAAKLNCKIYHGPFVYNFQEVYEILEKNRVSKKVNDYEELSDNLSRDLEAPKKINSELSNPIKNLEQKTLTDTMKIIDNFLYNDIN